MKSRRLLPLIAASVGILAVAALAAGQGKAPKSSPKSAITIRQQVAHRGATLKGDPDRHATYLANQAKRALQLTTDQGTKIGPHPDAIGIERASQMEIADLFAEQQPTATQARINQFSWLNDPEVRCNGWYGAIQKVTEGADPARIKVRMSPILISERAMSITTPYYVVETYELRQGILSLISVEAPASGTLKAMIQD